MFEYFSAVVVHYHPWNIACGLMSLFYNNAVSLFEQSCCLGRGSCLEEEIMESLLISEVFQESDY